MSIKPRYKRAPHPALNSSDTDDGLDDVGKSMIQWNLSITTTSKIKFITCDLFSNVF